MARINPRNVQNKSGVVYEAGSLTKIYAEDYRVFSDSLGSAGSEVYLWLYNRTTAERNALTPTGSGNIIFNTSTGSVDVYNGSTWISVGAGAGTSGLPQGVIPYGSLINALPQGVLPTGSIPSLSGLYIPQGQLISGSLPNTIQISGSLLANYIRVPTGSFSTSVTTGSLLADYGSFIGSLSAANIFSPQMSMGAGLSKTKFQLYDSSSTQQIGMGIQSNLYGFYLAATANRYGFYDDEAWTNELVTIMGVGSVGIGTGSSVAAGNILTVVGNGSFTGTLAATNFVGSLNAGSIFAGTISDSRLPTSMTGKTFTTNIIGTNGSFSGSLIFNGGTSNNNLSLAGNNLTGVNLVSAVHGSFTGSVTAGSIVSKGQLQVDASSSLLYDTRFTKSANINYIQSGSNRVASSWDELRFAKYTDTVWHMRIDAVGDVHAANNGSVQGSQIVGSSYITTNSYITYNAANQSMDFNIL